MLLRGLYPPLVTPFDADGRVDLDALEALAAELIEEGADGLVALGSTAEPFALSDGESAAVVETIARVCVDRDAQLIVGAGTVDTRATIARHEALAEVLPRCSLLVGGVRASSDDTPVGADETVDVDEEDLVPRVRSITGGRMADVVVDLADQAVVTVRLALDLAAMNGRVLLAGLKNMAPVELPSDLIVLKGLTLTGGPGSTPGSMRTAGELLREKRLPTRALRGEVLTLDELDEAMALVARTGDHDAVRVSLRHT
jgi:hypothetical protein